MATLNQFEIIAINDMARAIAVTRNMLRSGANAHSRMSDAPGAPSLMQFLDMNAERAANFMETIKADAKVLR